MNLVVSGYTLKSIAEETWFLVPKTSFFAT